MRIHVSLESKFKPFAVRPEMFDAMKAQFPEREIIFLDSKERLLAVLSEIEILLCWNFSKDLYKGAPKLKAIFTPAAGKDWVEDDPSSRVPVYHGNYHGHMISEAFLAMLLYFNNHMHVTAVDQKEKRWAREKLPARRLLNRQRIVIVGYGAIGRHCAEKLNAFGCEIVGLKRSPDMERDDLGVRLAPVSQMRKEIGLADHVLFLLPNSESTQHFFTYKEMLFMKRTAFLYNFGRGPCIRQADLVRALDEGRVAGAGLDVFEEEPLPPSDPLWSRWNVLMTPHSSCFYEEYLALFLESISHQLNNFG